MSRRRRPDLGRFISLGPLPPLDKSALCSRLILIFFLQDFSSLKSPPWQVGFFFFRKMPFPFSKSLICYLLFEHLRPDTYNAWDSYLWSKGFHARHRAFALAFNVQGPGVTMLRSEHRVMRGKYLSTANLFPTKRTFWFISNHHYFVLFDSQHVSI